MKEIYIYFNDFDCYKYFRKGLRAFLKDMVPHHSTLVEVVLNEAVNNAVKHGNDQKVIVKLKVQKNGKLLIRVKDNGHGFAVAETLQRISEKTHHNETNDSLLKESGRGLFIMQQVMDKVLYNRKGNDVLLIKNLQL